MKYRSSPPLLATALLALAGIAQAAPNAADADPLRLQYEREKAACLTGESRQPRQVCLREAQAAYAEARRGRLARPNSGPDLWTANALKRCEAQRGEDRTLCERRVREGQVTGSVEGGGQLSTLTVRSAEAPQSTGR